MADASIAYLCVTCGTQFAPSPAAPASCPICDDDRQYVRPDRAKRTRPSWTGGADSGAPRVLVLWRPAASPGDASLCSA